MTIYAAFVLLTFFGAMPVVAANEAPVQDVNIEMRIRSESIPAENSPVVKRPADSNPQAMSGIVAANVAPAQDVNIEMRIKSVSIPAENTPVVKRPADSNPQAMSGRIDLQSKAGEHDDAASKEHPSDDTNLHQRDPSTPSREAAHYETGNEKKKTRPRPDPNFAGTSIGTAGAKSVPHVEEKMHSFNKQGEITKARHVKSVVEHGDSPELQDHNEKRRSITEHFKARLEAREERRPKMSDKQGPAK
jgi:hypothetical protein